MNEDWRGLSDSGQRLTLARLIDTRNLAVGDYEVAIRIRDRVTGQALSPSTKVHRRSITFGWFKTIRFLFRSSPRTV